MESVKNTIDFYVNSNLHVAFACYCLVEITGFEFGLETIHASRFVFFATIFGYNFIRFAQLSKIHSSLSLWIRSKSRALVVVNFLAVAGMLYTALKIDQRALLLL